jgi:hypothetical protein
MQRDIYRSLKSALLCSALFISTLVAGNPTPKAERIVLLAPHEGTVCVEGEACPICWRSDVKGPLCIEAAFGGHDAGILNDCATPAAKGFFVWHIPRGRISGFGIRTEHNARIGIYPAGDPAHEVFSAPFTIRAAR